MWRCQAGELRNGERERGDNDGKSGGLIKSD